MTKQQELAQKLDGRKTIDGITKEEFAQAKEQGLIIIYSEEDEILTFEGSHCQDHFILDKKGLAQMRQNLDMRKDFLIVLKGHGE